jgi:hypothetical protein
MCKFLSYQIKKCLPILWHMNRIVNTSFLELPTRHPHLKLLQSCRQHFYWKKNAKIKLQKIHLTCLGQQFRMPLEKETELARVKQGWKLKERCIHQVKLELLFLLKWKRLQVSIYSWKKKLNKYFFEFWNFNLKETIL